VFWSFLPFLLMKNIGINAKKVFEVWETFYGVLVEEVLLLLEEDFLVKLTWMRPFCRWRRLSRFVFIYKKIHKAVACSCCCDNFFRNVLIHFALQTVDGFLFKNSE
jgi:hypothetical protein